MNRKLRKKWFLLIKAAVKKVFILLIFGTCLISVTKAHQQEVAVVQKPALVKLDVEKLSVNQMIKIVESQTGYYFSFDWNQINTKKSFRVDSGEQKLETLLAKMAAQTKLSYRILNNSIHLRKNQAAEKDQQFILQETVSGQVTDAESGETLPGVNVMIKGTTTGASTDGEGRFELTVESLQDTLIFSFIGYQTREVPVNGRNVIDVVLQPEIISGDELVVVGYGTVRREELSSSVSNISEEDFIGGAINNPIEMIDGKVPGLTMVNVASADPNSGSSLQIRGVASVNAGTGPLIVVDGVPGRDLNTIPKDEIEEITVLKDGASSAIYGARGANGVIIVTTKDGAGGTSVTYDGYLALNTAINQPEVLSAQEYVAKGRSSEYDPSEANDLPYANNFYEELLRDVSLENYHNLAIAGGSENSNYRLSLNYKQANGLDISSSSKDYGARLSFDHSVLDGISIHGNIAASKGEQEFTNYLAFRQAIKVQPTEPIFDPNNPNKYYLVSGYDYYNPVGLLKNNINLGDLLEINGDINLEWDVTNNFNTKLLVAESITENDDYLYSSSDSRDSRDNNYAGRAERGMSKSTNTILEWTINYFFERNNHNFQTLAGYSHQKFMNEGGSMWNADFPSDALLWNNLGGGTYHSSSGGQVEPSTYKSSNTLIGFFGRINYNYDETYLVSASLRREGSSKFGANNKWGLFPGVSLGWVVSNMSFFDEVGFIDNLKLRASYGVTGRENIESLLSVPYYRTHGSYHMGNSWMNSWGPASNPNPSLKWEVGINKNIGIDVTTANGNLAFSIDLYDRETNDLLFYNAVPKPPAIYSNTWDNIGSIRNRGIEFQTELMAVQTSNFQFNTTIVGNYGKSKLLQLSDRNSSDDSNYMDLYTLPAPGNPGPIVRLEEGEEIGSFHMYEHAGISEDGAFLIYDQNGEVIEATEKSIDDKKYVGNGIPDLTLSWDNTFKYKNFDLRLFFKGAFMWDVVNLHEMYYGLQNAPGNVLKSAYGKNSNIKAEKEASSYFMEKGDYLNLRNLSLGYRVPLADHSVLKELRTSINARNLVTVTSYSGMDPTQIEVNGLTPGIQSMDFYPSSRTFTVNVQLSF